MSIIRNDGCGGRGVTLVPASGSYSNLVVFMHGLGDTADGWASLMPQLGIKDTKFILPTADSIPIAINGGVSMPGWSNIYGLDAASPEDKPGFEATSARIGRIVQTEIDKGIAPKKIIIGGFSQGGAAALHYSLRTPHALGGAAGLSTWLPLRAEYPSALSPSALQMPIILFHGTYDAVVDFSWGENSFKLLKTLLPSDNTPSFVPIDGMGHSSDPEEIKKLRQFLLDKLDLKA